METIHLFQLFGNDLSEIWGEQTEKESNGGGSVVRRLRNRACHTEVLGLHWPP